MPDRELKLKSPRKPYCGIVALSSITGKPVSDLEYNVNMGRRRPKDSKIVGMQVKEVLDGLTDSGFEYEVSDLQSKTSFRDYKTNGNTQLLILDAYKGQGPHMIVMKDDLYVDSDTLKPTTRNVFPHHDRPIRAVVSVKKDGKPWTDLKGIE